MPALELRIALGALVFTLFGCGAASNAAWLNEPEAGMSLGSSHAAQLEHHAAPPAALDAEAGIAPAEPGGADSVTPRPRLARTVTLGETIIAGDAPPNDEPAAASGPVQVTVNNYVTVSSPSVSPTYVQVPRAHHHHGGRGESVRGPRVQAKPARANVIPGNDFPQPRSYGPSFPFKTAPASPWK